MDIKNIEVKILWLYNLLNNLNKLTDYCARLLDVIMVFSFFLFLIVLLIKSCTIEKKTRIL